MNNCISKFKQTKSKWAFEAQHKIQLGFVSPQTMVRNPTGLSELDFGHN